MKARYLKHPLQFILPAGTSRGVLQKKDSWFLFFTASSPSEVRSFCQRSKSFKTFFKSQSAKHNPTSAESTIDLLLEETSPREAAGSVSIAEQESKHAERPLTGIGECSLIPGLSPDDEQLLPRKMEELCWFIEQGEEIELAFFEGFPALKFAFETALIDLCNGGTQHLFSSTFSNGKSGIPMNGLIWMGPVEDMLQQVGDKIRKGFRVIKFKVGALDFEEELSMIKKVRENFSVENLEIRLDANGAWTASDALRKLEKLSMYEIHSIEQPVKAGHFSDMARVCSHSPIPVALDEELIPLLDERVRNQVLNFIRPEYLILKPSLLGGFAEADKWIKLAKDIGIGWWATSALESNIGLNAIAQWTASHQPIMPQGLGTGSLFSNNIPAPLKVKNASLWYDAHGKWDFSPLFVNSDARSDIDMAFRSYVGYSDNNTEPSKDTETE